jgi:hypothetical protein
MPKRYIKHRVSLLNKNGIKLAALIVEYRFVEKKELLDLLYSPNCRLNCSMQRAKSTHVPQLEQASKKLPSRVNRNSFFHHSPKGKTSR